MPSKLPKHRHSAWLKKPGMWRYRRAPGSPCLGAIAAGTDEGIEGRWLQHSSLFGMKRGDDFFGEDFGGPGDLDAEDIPRITELDGDAWGDLD